MAVEVVLERPAAGVPGPGEAGEDLAVIVALCSRNRTARWGQDESQLGQTDAPIDLDSPSEEEELENVELKAFSASLVSFRGPGGRARVDLGVPRWHWTMTDTDLQLVLMVSRKRPDFLCWTAGPGATVRPLRVESFQKKSQQAFRPDFLGLQCFGMATRRGSDVERDNLVMFRTEQVRVPARREGMAEAAGAGGQTFRWQEGVLVPRSTGTFTIRDRETDLLADAGVSCMTGRCLGGCACFPFHLRWAATKVPQRHQGTQGASSSLMAGLGRNRTDREVQYLYFFDNNKQRKKEKKQDFSCAFCLLSHPDFDALKEHMTVCHDLFYCEPHPTPHAPQGQPKHQMHVHCRREILQSLKIPYVAGTHNINRYPRSAESEKYKITAFREFYLTNWTLPPGEKPKFYSDAYGDDEKMERKRNRGQDVIDLEELPDSSLMRTQQTSILPTTPKLPAKKRKKLPSAAIKSLLTHGGREADVVQNKRNKPAPAPPAAEAKKGKGRKADARKATVRRPRKDPALLQGKLLKEAWRKEGYAQPDGNIYINALSTHPLEPSTVKDTGKASGPGSAAARLNEDKYLLSQFEDVSTAEKTYMHLWNAFGNENPILCNSMTERRVLDFLAKHGAALLGDPAVYRCMTLHLVHLWDHGILDERQLERCMSFL